MERNVPSVPEETLATVTCPCCGKQLTVKLACQQTVTPPVPEEDLPLIEDIPETPAAPETWTLPMSFREYNPWGYVHGQINSKGQLHPGYDLNDGPNAHADLGQPIYAPRPGTVVLAKHVPGWGTLLCVLLDEAVDGRRVVARFGHVHEFKVRLTDRVEAGQLIATCGDGGLPDRWTPHLHYDLLDVGVLWELSKKLGLKDPNLTYYSHGHNRELFDRLYLDPRRFHPEIDAALTRVGK